MGNPRFSSEKDAFSFANVSVNSIPSLKKDGGSVEIGRQEPLRRRMTNVLESFLSTTLLPDLIHCTREFSKEYH